MPIRVKLLILLLVIALLPVATVIWYELRATRALGLELADRARQVLEERGVQQMLATARGAAELVLRERRLLEGAAGLQARAVERALAAEAGRQGGRIARGADALQPDAELAGIPVDAGALAVGGPDAVVERFGGLLANWSRVRRDFAPEALWQRLVLLDDAGWAVYPAHAGAFAAPAELMARLRPVLEGGAVLTLPPAADPWTGVPVLTVAAPVRSEDGAVIGAVSIDVPLAAVVGRIGEHGFAPARVLVAEPAPDGDPTVRILAEREGRGVIGRDVLVQAAGLTGVLDDMRTGRTGVRRILRDGEDAYWAHAPIDTFGTNLLFVVPHRDVVADALAAEQQVYRQLAERRAVLWGGLLFFLPVLVVLALFASRAVTRPVNQLADAARELADGNFDARTDIRSGDELEELGRLFNEMVPQLAASIRMRDSLGLAQEVQQHLLPRQAPEIPGFDIHGVSLYCDETGGDYFDFMPLPSLGPGVVTVMVGDVAGHGASAALLMTTARALLRAREPRRGHLADRVGEVNRHLCRDAHGGRFMTLFMAVLDADAQRIDWVSAGHGSGFIYDPAQSAFMEISGPDIPLGVDPGWHYEELSHVGWSPGTVMLVGTDGIWETRNAEGAMFGKPSVWRVIRANAHRSSAEIAAELIAALTAFRDGRPQVDDVTMVVVKAV